MKIILALLFAFSVHTVANADTFKLNIYFNLEISEKHGIVKCRQGGNQLSTDYHLIVFRDKPKYTILGNLDLDKDVIGNVEGKLNCDEGEFTLVKSIDVNGDSINLFIYLVEIYIIKDNIFNITNIKLSDDHDYFTEYEFINEAGHAVKKIIYRDDDDDDDDDDIDDSDLIYRIELRRK